MLFNGSPSEELARIYIAKKHGLDLTQVAHNNKVNPDFILPDGAGYEVKLQNTKFCVNFTTKQLADLAEFAKSHTVRLLVYDRSGNGVGALLLDIPFMGL